MSSVALDLFGEPHIARGDNCVVEYPCLNEMFPFLSQGVMDFVQHDGFCRIFRGCTSDILQLSLEFRRTLEDD